LSPWFEEEGKKKNLLLTTVLDAEPEDAQELRLEELATKNSRVTTTMEIRPN